MSNKQAAEEDRSWRKRRHTERIPQPVGINAKMLAKTSATVSSVNTIAVDKPAMASKNDRPWTKRNSNWKLTEIFWLNVNTCGIPK